MWLVRVPGHGRSWGIWGWVEGASILPCLEEFTSEDGAVCEGGGPTAASPTLSCSRAG